MNLLVKTDPELGYAFFCPACKYHTVGGEACLFCGEPLEWPTFEEGFGSVPLYRGRVKWPTEEEIDAAYNLDELLKGYVEERKRQRETEGML